MTKYIIICLALLAVTSAFAQQDTQAEFLAAIREHPTFDYTQWSDREGYHAVLNACAQLDAMVYFQDHIKGQAGMKISDINGNAIGLSTCLQASLDGSRG
jgi:hypothetical protein